MMRLAIFCKRPLISLELLQGCLYVVLSAALMGCGGSDFFGFDDPGALEEETEEEVAETTDVVVTQKEEEVEVDDELQPATAEDPAPEVVDVSEEEESELVSDTEVELAAPEVLAPAPSVVVVPPVTEIIGRDVVLQRFSTDFIAKHRAVDLLFVVDNSYSMDHEIDQVRSNLQNFFNQLASYSDVKVGVLSAFRPSDEYNAVSIPNDAQGVVMVDQRVRSWNGLWLSHLFINDELYNSTGVKGSEFFRQESLKVFVVITDDNSNDFSAEEFSESLSEHFSLDEVRLYGFIGLPQSTSPAVAMYPASAGERLSACNIYDEGKVYYELLEKTLDGGLFDICQKDWSEHFQKMAGFVLKEVKSRYPLSQPAHSLVSIKVEGKEVPRDQVIIESGILTFKEGVLPTDRDVFVEIRYHKKSEVVSLPHTADPS